MPYLEILHLVSPRLTPHFRTETQARIEMSVSTVNQQYTDTRSKDLIAPFELAPVFGVWSSTHTRTHVSVRKATDRTVLDLVRRRGARL